MLEIQPKQDKNRLTHFILTKIKANTLNTRIAITRDKKEGFPKRFFVSEQIPPISLMVFLNEIFSVIIQIDKKINYKKTKCIAKVKQTCTNITIENTL